ncbi:hypothetical protein E2C01_087649 [Portunus trituberculatus]|uniref:Uncharacterized protein n=1 Tax=Portunus trituberculatus TaxID=210409 RepID=A0A5B7JJX1_PORTR|nr:hypothetical protein [Portunus trituberculatus]
MEALESSSRCLGARWDK